MEGWVKIFKSTQVIEAEMVKAMLADQGIEAVVMNQVDRSWSFGEASVFCKEEDEETALTLLKTKPAEENE